MNLYGRQLSEDEISSGAHRDFVGGLWDEIGPLQLDFLIAKGLRPEHRLVDIGCGALRGGVHFTRYLNPGNYHGLDINASLLEAGKRELIASGLDPGDAHLLQDDAFRISRFGAVMDRALAVSVFTHLPINVVVRCLKEVAAVLHPEGVFYASIFEAPVPGCLKCLEHQPGGVVTHYDCDPFHLSVEEYRWMAGLAGLRLEVVGDWGHPRGQRMLAFHHSVR